MKTIVVLSLFILTNVEIFAQGTQLDSSPIYYLNGMVGVGDTSPNAALEVIGSALPAGVPVFVVNNTYANNTSDPDQNRPFQIRRHDSSKESLSMFIQDGYSHIVYKNDESASAINFRIVNSDTESGGGAAANDNVVMSLRGNSSGGFVAIGTTNFDYSYRLAVNGAIRAKEIKVETGWSDFVFEEDYSLRSLAEVEQFIKSNKHLPDIPSAKEVEANGVNLGAMDAKLLQKIEELTLYVIELKKEVDKQYQENKKFQEEFTKLKSQLKNEK